MFSETAERRSMSDWMWKAEVVERQSSAGEVSRRPIFPSE